MHQTTNEGFRLKFDCLLSNCKIDVSYRSLKQMCTLQKALKTFLNNPSGNSETAYYL